MSIGPSPLALGYVALFLLAAVGCGVGSHRARRIDHPDTRRGLVGLLLISGAWAFVQGVRLLAPTTDLKIAFDIIGLVIGLASVGAWLYFCSAYTGQSYHRNSTLRRAALSVFVAISAVKLTNPIHGLYFSVQPVAEPFAHLLLIPGPFHWVTVGIAYMVSALGFYMLFELFHKTRYDTQRLSMLVSLAAIPAIGTVASYVGIGPLVQMDYEPIGVALFAIGTLYFAEETFQGVHHHGRIQVLDEIDEAILLLDDADTLRDYNLAASELFPDLTDDTLGTSLPEVVPHIAAAIDDTQQIVEHPGTNGQRYFAINDEPLSLGPHEVGQAVILTEVTELERQRRELTQREDQLDDVAEALTHELRNAVTIVQGYLTLASKSLNQQESTTVKERFETARETTERMSRIINDLVTLAQHGGLVSETDPCDLGELVTDAELEIDADDLSVTVEKEGTIEGDRVRLVKLFRQALRFAAANGASHVRISLTDDGVMIEDDGEPVATGRGDDIFEYGEAVPDAERGSILPPVRTLAHVHGGDVTVDTTYQDGLRYRITGLPTHLSD